MLYEIKFNLFKDDSKKINFKTELNIVLGENDKANSIGKSTFLLIIDFAFGGNSYTDKKNKIVELFGNHTIYFAHKFENKIYYFLRSTENPGKIFQCDKNYQILEKEKEFTLTGFTNFLKRLYKIESELSFREIVSPYSHIAGRFETDFDNPLKIEGDTSQSKSINRFEKLFKVYKTIKSKAQELEQAENKITSFKNAKNFGFIKISIESQKDKKTLEEELKNLETELEQTKFGKAKDLFIFEEKSASECMEIKSKLKSLRSIRSKLQSEIAAIEKIDSNANPSEQDLKVLQSFFPQVNLQKINDISSFHSNVCKIVNKECDDEILKLTKKLNQVLNKIEELENKISPEFQDISQTILEQFAKKSIRINQIKEELKKFDLKNSLNEEKSKIEKEFSLIQENALSKIANEILITLQLFNKENGALVFEFPTQKSYRLYKENDVGTGTKHLNLILFDLAVLLRTEIPYLIHDSYIFHELEDNRLNLVLSFYKEYSHGKQIFIAVDGQDKCSEEAKKIIKESTILKLGKNKESLFGITK